MTTPINRDELQAKLTAQLSGNLDGNPNGSQPVILIEALPESYFAEAHLPGAINIPHRQVETLASTLLPDKSAEIVVYCSNSVCQNSTIAAETLEKLGYTNVRDYKDGKQDWVNAGLPTETLNPVNHSTAV
ncbi:MAG TPA: rhodanese-like domain-containing protein [Chroococcidiopsis sp.]